MSDVQEDDIPPDPLIDEVRAIRRKISDRFGNDIDKLCDHLQELERQHPERVVHPKAENGRVALGDCSPRAPTDPYVRD